MPGRRVLLAVASVVSVVVVARRSSREIGRPGRRISGVCPMWGRRAARTVAAMVQLDRVEAEAGGFAALQAPDARDLLLAWSGAGEPDGTAGDPRRTLAASALTLASLRFEEDELRQVGYTLELA